MNLRRAFTLPELVVGMGITSGLLMIMLQVFSDSSTVWQKSDERLDTFREARAAIQTIARDLSSLSPIPRVETIADDPIDRFPMLALEHHPEGNPDDHLNQEVYGIIGTRNKGRATFCAVGYYCVWDEKRTAFVLKRQFTDGDSTFALLSSALTVSATPDAKGRSVPSLTGVDAFAAIFKRFNDPDDSHAKHHASEDLASYVWDFQVEIPSEDFPDNVPAWPQGYFGREFPQWIEIRFKALGGNAVRKIEGQRFMRETWFEKDSDKYQRYILPGEQQFVTRVKLCR